MVVANLVYIRGSAIPVSLCTDSFIKTVYTKESSFQFQPFLKQKWQVSVLNTSVQSPWSMDSFLLYADLKAPRSALRQGRMCGNNQRAHSAEDW